MEDTERIRPAAKWCAHCQHVRVIVEIALAPGSTEDMHNDMTDCQFEATIRVYEAIAGSYHNKLTRKLFQEILSAGGISFGWARGGWRRRCNNNGKYARNTNDCEFCGPTGLVVLDRHDAVIVITALSIGYWLLNRRQMNRTARCSWM